MSHVLFRGKSTGLRVGTVMLLLLSVLLAWTAAGSSSSGASASSSSSCDVARDDIRFFGSGGDAGRVELCWQSTWRYVCSQQEKWSLSTADIACRQLGYRSAFMADTAANMAFGATVNSGVTEAGIVVMHCRGDERSLRECQLRVDGDGNECTIHEAVAAACSTAASDTAASTYPAALEERVQSYMVEMAAWYAASEKERSQQQQHLEQQQQPQECVVEEGGTLSWFQQQGIPTPFHDVGVIQEAFVFPDVVTSIYEPIQTDFNRSTTTTTGSAITTTMELLQEALPKIRWNAFGMDLSDFFPPPMTLDQVRSVLSESRPLGAVRDLYLSANRHNAIHWFLDSPYRYYSQPPAELQLDPTARQLFETLQRNGMVVIEDFGADTEAIVQLAEAALTGDSLYRKNETSIAGGGSILTSRKPIPQLDDLLIYNKTLAAVINAYLGPSILHGYKVTRLTKGLTSTDQYNAGMYHHDRVGRRLKLFMFLNDVDCEMGHPTRVAAGSQNLLYYKSEDYPVTRFANAYVEANYEIIKGCGKRGGGFLFDTHTIHKGTVEGDRERTVVIAEYHHIAKCAYSKEYNLGIPCPGGDLHRTDTPLATTS